MRPLRFAIVILIFFAYQILVAYTSKVLLPVEFSILDAAMNKKQLQVYFLNNKSYKIELCSTPIRKCYHYENIINFISVFSVA